MSESSLSRTAVRTRPLPSDGEPPASLAVPPGERLPGQRWFTGNGRPVRALVPVAATAPLPPKLPPKLRAALIGRPQEGRLLGCFGYEVVLRAARHRPAWPHVPMSAIRRPAAAPVRR